MQGSLLLFFAAILVIGALLFLVINITKHTGKQLDQSKYQSDWLKIQQSINKDQPASLSMAILDADKLLDRALRDRGFKGETMGERLKSAQSSWTSANTTWQAHKLRNKIAHETGTTVSYAETAQALSAFKRSLKDIGAI